MPNVLSFPLNTAFATGAVDLNLDPALAIPGALLPAVDTVIATANIAVSPGNPIAFGPAKVGFSADANASIGIFTSPASVRAAVLDNAPLVADLADTLAFAGEVAASKFLMLRWGYDISANVSGEVALAPTANLSFSGDAGSKGFYALITGVKPDAEVNSSLDQLFGAWKLPLQVSTDADLPPFTTLITEVDASFNAGAKVSFGYEFNWLRTLDVPGLGGGTGLKGDIGLKLDTALSASLGFGMSGKYAIVLSSGAAAARQLRMRLFMLRVSDLNLGFEAAITATPSENFLPPDPNDLIEAVFGIHGQQIVKLLGQVQDWTDPSKPVFGPFVNLVDTEAQTLIKNLTGVADLAAEFDKIKVRIQEVFTLWTNLPQSLTRLLWSKLPESAAIADISTLAGQVAGLDATGLTQLIEAKLVDVPFLSSIQGQALEAMAVNGLFATLQDSAALADIQEAAGTVQTILDGAFLQNFLTKLQDAVNTKLDFTKINSLVDQTSFDSLDTWLKARLESFLEKDLVGADGLKELNTLRDGVAKILAKKDELYAKALAILNSDYTFDLHATYQSTTTSLALMDVTFDFATPGSQATDGLQLALRGKFDDLLQNPLAGVTVTNGVLAFGLHKEKHVTLTLPHFIANSSNVSDSVASLKTVDASAGGLIYSLEASDLYTFNNDFSSALSIVFTAPAISKNVLIHSTDASAYRYELAVNQPRLTRQGLTLQYATYAKTYFPTEFKDASPGSFSDWVDHIVPVDDKGNFIPFGNSLVSLSLSLPSSAIEAWSKAPADGADPVYKLMSMALQQQFRQTLHDEFFSDIGRYKEVGTTAAWAVLAFSSLPPFSDIVLVNNGDDARFLSDSTAGNTIYWDFTDHLNIGVKPALQKILFNPRTEAGLFLKLQIAQARLTEAGASRTEISFYDPKNLGNIFKAVIEGEQAQSGFLNSLFIVEQGLVEGARKAGQRMAAFTSSKFTDPAQARVDLAAFGETLANNFNNQLKTFAVGNALMPLGTAIYAGAVSTLASTGATQPSVVAKPAAMFKVQTLKPGVVTLSAQDTDVVRTQVVVHAP